MTADFELDEPTTLLVKNVSPRKEHHGEELVQAIDVDLEWETSNESLVLLGGHLLDSLYWRDSSTEAQQDVPGVPAIKPNLRNPKLEMPLKWDLELKGRNFRIDHGMGGKSDLVLPTSTVKKFRITVKEGGTSVIGFQVQCNVDVNEKIVGKLCALEGEEVSGTLTASEEPGE